MTCVKHTDQTHNFFLYLLSKIWCVGMLCHDRANVSMSMHHTLVVKDILFGFCPLEESDADI